MRNGMRAATFVIGALLSLVAGCLLAARFTGTCLVWVVAGVAGYVALGSRAMAFWKMDEKIFERPPRARLLKPRMILLWALFAALAAHARAQQTIFNVPSADVLGPRRVYLEVDELFRPAEPRFSSTTVRGVVGLFPRVEAGVNFGGLISPGPVVPTATVAVKAQPLRLGDFALTAGGFGLFYLRGARDGDPAGLGYGFASYRIPKIGTRIEVGGWYSSAGYATPGSTGGALATLEQPIPGIPALTLAADWWSGENAIGYVSPGLVYTLGRWTAYASYSIKNGDSRGNAGLVELGYSF